jgi:hypothetical protein
VEGCFGSVGLEREARGAPSLKCWQETDGAMDNNKGGEPTVPRRKGNNFLRHQVTACCHSGVGVSHVLSRLVECQTTGCGCLSVFRAVLSKDLLWLPQGSEMPEETGCR